MDGQHFDYLARQLGRHWNRRRLTALLAVAAATRQVPMAAAPVSGQRLPLADRQEVNTTCLNLGTACGDTRVCQCLLDKGSVQTCQNVVDSPSGRGFAACQTTANCPAGQVCDARASVCRLTCATPVPDAPPRSSGSVTCQNLGTACGNTAICQCRLDTSSVQVCQNRLVAPNGVAFLPCDANDDCGPDQVCDASDHVCVSTCMN